MKSGPRSEKALEVPGGGLLRFGLGVVADPAGRVGGLRRLS